jgi:copper transport protein
VRRWLPVLLTLLAGAVLSVLLAAPASAHTVLLGSDPANGSRLTQSPESVTLRFNEQVGLRLGYLRVTDSSGQRVDSGPASHPGGVGSSVSVPLRSGLGDGSYLASYRVISADSHPIAGTIRYVVGDGPLDVGGDQSSGSGTAPVDPAVRAGLALSHWISFAGVGLVGGSWLVFALWPAGLGRRSVRRLVWVGWSLAGLGAATEFLLEGPYAAGSSLSSLTQTALLDATLHSTFGQFLSLRLLLLGILGMVLTALLGAGARSGARAGEGARADGEAQDAPSWGPGAVAGIGFGIVITFAATGHAQSANPHELWVLVDAVHLSSMIIWLGGLTMLLVAAFGRGSAEHADRDADRAQLSAGLPVFSRVAMVCIATLAVTGTLQAWREIGDLDAITGTRYGQLVVLKVVLFAGVLGLGYLARRAVQRSAAKPAPSEMALALASGGVPPGPSSAVPPGPSSTTPAGPSSMVPAPRSRSGLPAGLSRTLLSEVAIGALVLAATAVLVSQPPGKVALAAERSQPRQATVQLNAQTQALVSVEPGVQGNVRITVRLSGGPPPTGVTATASLPAKQLGPIPVPLQAAGAGSYTSTGVLLPAAGVWELRLTVRTSEFDSTVAVAKIELS